MADPITFAFLLTAWTAESPAANVYVEDSGLSGADCVAAIATYNAADPTWSRGNPSCEIDVGFEESLSHEYAVEIGGRMYIFLPCPSEDSANCIWDARWRGDGHGQSFVDLDGKVYDITFGDHDEIIAISERS